MDASLGAASLAGVRQWDVGPSDFLRGDFLRVELRPRFGIGPTFFRVAFAIGFLALAPRFAIALARFPLTLDGLFVILLAIDLTARSKRFAIALAICFLTLDDCFVVLLAMGLGACCALFSVLFVIGFGASAMRLLLGGLPRIFSIAKLLIKTSLWSGWVRVSVSPSFWNLAAPVTGGGFFIFDPQSQPSRSPVSSPHRAMPQQRASMRGVRGTPFLRCDRRRTRAQSSRDRAGKPARPPSNAGAPKRAGGRP